ncbi:ABC transporter permease [Geodermatophilus ruber]|uniref:NitT/TauT family transport system permease protein n=1 Tax=Geodermatophilus ruber TaxID=504800 RepID=A0A1I4C9L2_9ACTN|nr:ABC transporter permease [Geodermatophilus ruber]SFK77017.1 NitT/TauT family transport system permease protein [Geodermatophilus ruber]
MTSDVQPVDAQRRLSRRPTPEGEGRGGRPTRTTRRSRLWRGVVGVLALGLVLEFVTRIGLVSPTFLPPFTTILGEAVDVVGRQDFQEAVLSTVVSWGAGLALSAAVAIPLGVVLGLSQVSYRATRAVLDLLRPIPPIALIPLVILVMGQGLEMKLVLVVFAALWPILFNTISGVHDVDVKAKEMARSFGFSRLAVIRRVVVPSAAPFIATGVRLSSSIALIVVITVELIAGGASGMGTFVAEARAVGNQTEVVYAGTLLIGVVGLVINLLMGAAERRFFGWHTTKDV